MRVFSHNLKTVAVGAALVGLSLVGGVKANAQVLFSYTSTTIFDSSGTNSLTVASTGGSTKITVDPAFDNADNAASPGTDIKQGAFVVTASTGGNAVFAPASSDFTTTLVVKPLGLFTGDTMTYILHGYLDTIVNPTQVNDTFVGITNLPMTETATVGNSTLHLTTSGFLSIDPNGNVLTQQPHFDGINPLNGTTAGGFTIHISGFTSSSVPEPGALALLVSCGMGGLALLRRRRA